MKNKHFILLFICFFLACTKEENWIYEPISASEIKEEPKDTVVIDSVIKRPISTVITSEDTVTLYYSSSNYNLWKYKVKGVYKINDSVKVGTNMYVVLKNKKGKKAKIQINNYVKSDSLTCSNQDTLIIGFYQVK